jgi:signal recognition particle GTPase
LDGSFAVGDGAAVIRGLIMKCQELQLKYEKVSVDTNNTPEPLEKAKPTRMTEKDLVHSKGGGKDFLYSAAKQKSLINLDILTALDEVKATKSLPSWISGKNLSDAKGDIRAYLQSLGTTLNTSQKAAIETAAIRKVTLWQGPPGTGKTTTLTHLVAALCRQRLKVLACADRWVTFS